MNTVYLDIETIPCQSPEYREEVRANITAPAQYKKPESIAEWIEKNGDAAADEIVAKTSFDPAHGHICTIGFAIGDGEVRRFMRKPKSASSLSSKASLRLCPSWA